MCAGVTIIIACRYQEYLVNFAEAFQVDPNVLRAPHMQFIYPNTPNPGQVGYGPGTGSQRQSHLTRNASSDKKNPYDGFYDYIDTMKQLERQRNQNKVEIQIGSEFYNFSNPNRIGTDELQYELA